MEATPPRKSKLYETARRLLPWLVSIGLLAYLASTTDLARVWDALQRARLGLFVTVALVGTLLAFLYDSVCLTLLLRRFNAPVTLGEVLPLKGASYFLNVINYNAAMGGMALYLRRVRGVSFLESASSLLFMNVLDVFALCGLIAVGLVASGDALGASVGPEARHGLVVVLVALAAVLVGNLVYWNAGFDFFVLGRLRSWRIFHAFREARLLDYAWLMALRLPLLLLYVAMMWLFAHAFRIDISYPSALALQPIVIFVGTVPISVAGLGTTQVLMRSFYGPFAAYLALREVGAPLLGGLHVPLAAAPGGGVASLAAGWGVEGAAAAYYDPTPLVDAFSTASIFGIVLVRVALGYGFLHRVSRALAEGAGRDGAEENVS